MGVKGLRITLSISIFTMRLNNCEALKKQLYILLRLYFIECLKKRKNASSERVKPIGFHSAVRIFLFKYFN